LKAGKCQAMSIRAGQFGHANLRVSFERISAT
jgi:hypothetical protein